LFIRWHGHSCFEVGNDDGPTVITDPHDGRSIGIKPPVVKGDIILISHSHFDHSSAKTVSKKESRVVEREGSFRIRDVKIKGVPSFHDEVEGRKRGNNIIFRFELGDYRLCHLGDLGHVLDERTIRALQPLDILFIPVGGVFTLEPQLCWKVVQDLGVKLIIPMHYKTGGLSLSIQRLDEFLKYSPGITEIKVGNEIDFDSSDIAGGPTLWEFSL
jgi:L-ascorbate metabolism protein UlaG (beta-lactamase superfamily)